MHIASYSYHSNYKYILCALLTGASPASTVGASQAELRSALALTHGIVTPPCKMRRYASAPALDEPSRQKTEPAVRVKRAKTEPAHPELKAGVSATSNMTLSHNQPDPPPAAVLLHAQPVTPADQQPNVSTTKTAQTLPTGNTVPKTTGPATAAKSLPAPKRDTAVVQAAPAVKAEPDGVKSPATPGPVSEIRQRHAAIASLENLRRPESSQQLPGTPAPSPPAAPPDPRVTLNSGPGDSEEPNEEDDQHEEDHVVHDKEKCEPEGDAGGGEGTVETTKPAGRKPRREKTQQEKANHARFMRFSRHIQSC